LFAAAIALRTCLGAFAGGSAVPSTCSVAVPLGAVGVVVLGVVVLGVVVLGVVVLPGDPVPPVCAIAGTAQISDASVTPAMLSVFDRKPFSFVGLRG
jgi:hypothetical protein